ncbi:MAG: DUF4468 domain-containing protein [Cytophagaceae bacterium]|nr:DUF4468 domain-containing protein [Cytophagaceae bacterium]
MKSLILSIILAISSFTFTFSQSFPTDPETKKISYQETVILDSLTKDEIYERAKEWMTNFFKTNKFDVNDKVNYKLVNEGFLWIKQAHVYKFFHIFYFL